MANNDNQVTYFAETDARNKRVKFGIKAGDRSKHTYVIGKTGMGKSTLLENMAIQDIMNGNGLAFIDPHGKTAQLLLDYIPESRIKDVLYFAPFDMDYPVSFNVMEDVGPDRRHLVVNGLMSAFKKIWVDAWSARMEYILNNTLLALLEYPGATLLGVNRMLADKDYRKKVVENVKDPSIKSFWVDEFAKYTEKFAAEATPAIQNKVGQFTSNPLIRNIIGQPKSTFDIRRMMDEKKIVIINLSKGLVGESNANLLGSMLITKIYLAAMSRADMTPAEMNKAANFYLYVDEFQSFANESFADILSEARKYKLNLTIAHQYIEQMPEEVRAAVFGNVGTMIAFRVGAYDAEVLEKEFAPYFLAPDIVNLDKYQLYLKLMIDGVASQPFSALGLGPIDKPAISYTKEIMESSRSQFGKPRTEVEAEIRTFHEESHIAPKKPAMPAKEKSVEAQKIASIAPTFSTLTPTVSAPVQFADMVTAPVVKKDVAPIKIEQKSVPAVRSEPKTELRPRHESTPKDSEGLKKALRGIAKPAKVEMPSTAEIEKAIARGELTPVEAPQANKSKTKEPAKDHTKDLRSALASLLKDVKPAQEEVQIAPTSTSTSTPIPSKPVPLTPAPVSFSDILQKKMDQQQAKLPSDSVESGQNEVPEDVLRRILDVNN